MSAMESNFFPSSMGLWMFHLYLDDGKLQCAFFKKEMDDKIIMKNYKGIYALTLN